MNAIACSWRNALDGFEDGHWRAWDAIVHATGRPSFFLDSRNVKALFDDPERLIWAVIWHEGSVDQPDTWCGVAIVEDTHAESHSLDRHLESKSRLFHWVNRMLHGQDGVLRFPVRVMGSVLGSGGHAYRFNSSVPSDQRRALVSEALSNSLRESSGRGAPRVALVKDFPLPEGKGLRDLGKTMGHWAPGWVDLEFDPVMSVRLNPEWNALENYLEELRTKSRTKVKRILACSAHCLLERWNEQQIQSNVSKLHALYLQVYSEASFRLGTLLPEDLVAAKRHWGEDFMVQVIQHEGRMVAFQCGYFTGTTIEAFFVGFDRELNRDLSLYQRMLVEFIRWGIEKGAEEVSMGRTALDIKSSVGGMPEGWSCAVRFRNPLLQRSALFAARRSWPQRPALKRAWKSEAYPISMQFPNRETWV